MKRTASLLGTNDEHKGSNKRQRADVSVRPLCSLKDILRTLPLLSRTEFCIVEEAVAELSLAHLATVVDSVPDDVWLLILKHMTKQTVDHVESSFS